MIMEGSDTTSVIQADFDAQWAGFLEYLYDRVDDNPADALSSMVFLHRWRVSRWTLQVVTRTMEVMMARGKKAQVGTKDGSNGYSTVFVDVPLAGATAADVQREFGNSDTLTNTIQAVCESGYRIGVTYNAATDSVIASMTCRAEGDPNIGCTMNAFAGDWVTALQVLMYKHIVISKMVWRSAAVQASRNAIG